jgi:hypothetical protein
VTLDTALEPDLETLPADVAINASNDYSSAHSNSPVRQHALRSALSPKKRAKRNQVQRVVKNAEQTATRPLVDQALRTRTQRRNGTVRLYKAVRYRRSNSYNRLINRCNVELLQ